MLNIYHIHNSDYIVSVWKIARSTTGTKSDLNLFPNKFLIQMTNSVYKDFQSNLLFIITFIRNSQRNAQSSYPCIYFCTIFWRDPVISKKCAANLEKNIRCADYFITIPDILISNNTINPYDMSYSLFSGCSNISNVFSWGRGWLVYVV